MRKLPIAAAFGHAFNSTVKNISFAFYASWPWMLAILPFNIFGNAYVMLNQLSEPLQSVSSGVVLVSILIGLLTMVAFASIAVNWHRYILLDEVPQGLQRLRLDVTVWSYIGNTILMVLMIFAAELVFVIIGFIFYYLLGNLSLVLIIPAATAFLLFLMAYFYRLSLKLPGIAVGNSDVNFGSALKATEGNNWPLIGLVLLILLIALAIGAVISGLTYVLTNSGSNSMLYVVIGVQFMVNWLTTIFGVTLLTSLYGFFIEGRDF
jgi:hypothetical protein